MPQKFAADCEKADLLGGLLHPAPLLLHVPVKSDGERTPHESSGRHDRQGRLFDVAGDDSKPRRNAARGFN